MKCTSKKIWYMISTQVNDIKKLLMKYLFVNLHVGELIGFTCLGNIQKEIRELEFGNERYT